MWPFKKKQQASPIDPPAAINAILVPESLHRSDDPHDLPNAVVQFVNRTIHEGFYERGELPVEALWSYNVDYYLAQVNNGGHGQFAGNSRWLEAIVMDIQDGLEAMGLAEALGIFRDLMRFAADEPDRFVRAAEGGGFGEIDPVIRALDDRFFASPSSTIAPGNGRWLRSLPNLIVLPDAECDARIAALVAANTAAPARQAERTRLVQEADERDPLVQAFQHLLTLPRQRRVYQGWTAGFPREQDDGSVAHVFGVDTNAGRVNAILTASEAQLRDAYVDVLLARTPMEKLDRVVFKKTGRTLSETLSQ